MVIVEMYDDEVIDNIAASLKFKNDEIIYVGYNLRNMQKNILNIEKYFKEIGRDIKISCVEVIKNNLPLMVESLEEIINSDYYNKEDFVFDVTGGDDLILVAMGVISERYGINLMSFDVNKSKILWQTQGIDESRYSINEGRNELCVRGNIVLHGGEIVGPDNNAGVYYEWQYTDEFIQDVMNMWNICRNDCGKWNREVSQLQHYTDKSSSLIIGRANTIMKELVRIGILKQHSNRLHEIYSFKNEQIKECLMKVGNILELYTGITAMKMLKEDGTKHFCDVKVGVNIDWDGIIHDIHDFDKDTRNEIDVILMKGVCPIFVSCKNGDVGIDELYKLNTVAEKFGGKYAKKVLVATYFGKKGVSHEYFLQRAVDMKIQVIPDVHRMDQEDFINRLHNL